MSRGQKARTPENFPRMNDRAGRRRYRRAVQLITREGEGDPMVGFSRIIARIGAAAAAVVDGIARVFSGFVESSRTQNDYALMSPPLIEMRGLPLVMGSPDEVVRLKGRGTDHG